MGPGVGKPPLEAMGGKCWGAAPHHFPLGFGSELAREALHRQAAGQGGSMAAVETPFSWGSIDHLVDEG